MSLVVKPSSISQLTANVSKAIKNKTCFLGKECEIISENPKLSLREVISNVQKVFDRLVVDKPPNFSELAALKGALILYGKMVYFENCNLDCLKFQVHPELTALMKKIDQMASSIPFGSDRSAPLRDALHRFYEEQSRASPRQFYTPEVLAKARKFMSLALIDTRLFSYYQDHVWFSFTDYLCLKIYGMAKCKKTEMGTISDWSTNMPQELAALNKTEKVRLYQELTQLNFGLGIVLSSLGTYSIQEKDSNIIQLSRMSRSEAMKYCHILRDALDLPDLKPLHRQYLIYSLHSTLTYCFSHLEEEKVEDIVACWSSVPQEDQVLLPYNIENLGIFEVFQKLDENALERQKYICRIEKTIAELKGKLEKAQEESVEKTELLTEESSVEKIELLAELAKKETLLEIFDFTQLSLESTIKIKGVLEEYVLTLPEYTKLYTLFRSKIFTENRLQLEQRRETLASKRPYYEKDQERGPIFPENFFTRLDKIEPLCPEEKSSKKKKSGKKAIEIAPIDAKIDSASSSVDAKLSGDNASSSSIASTDSALLTSDLSEERISDELPAPVPPAPDLVYSSWVSDWFTNPEKALGRSQYAHIRHLPKVREKIVAFHTLPIEIDRYLDYGIVSSRPDKKRGADLKHISIPCQVELPGHQEVYQGVIGYCMNEKGEYFHRCFSTKPPNEMVEQLLQKGFLNIDFPVLGEVLEQSRQDEVIETITSTGACRITQLNHYTIMFQTSSGIKVSIFKMKV